MNGLDPHQTDVFQRLDQTASHPYPRRVYLGRIAWEWVQTTLIRFSPRRAYGWRRFWLRRFGAHVSATSRIRPRTRIMHPWLLELGAHTSLADDVNVYNLGPIVVGDHTVISQGTHLCAGTHDHTRSDLPLQRPPITVGRGVWVCAEAFIGPGVTVGDNSIVAARAVVVKDVPAGMIVAGNPAAVVKARPRVR